MDSRLRYNHGVITQQNKEKWMERQRQYLVPLIRRRMQLIADNENNEIPSYIEKLFNHFCDRKSNINLSCIRMEMEFMEQSLRELLFKKEDDGGYTVDIGALTVLFPNLKRYITAEGVDKVISKQ